MLARRYFKVGSVELSSGVTGGVQNAPQFGYYCRNPADQRARAKALLIGCSRECGYAIAIFRNHVAPPLKLMRT